MTTAQKFLDVFIVGTVLTFALAGALYLAGYTLAALGVIVVSPFPCPTGVPC